MRYASGKIKVGSKISFQFYNTPEKRFYGDIKTATVIEIDPNNKVGKAVRPLKIRIDSNGWECWITYHEARQVIK